MFYLLRGSPTQFGRGVAEDFSEGAGKIVAVVEPRRERRLRAVGFAGAQQRRRVLEPVAQQDLVERGPGGAFQDAVELVGACGAGAGGLRKGEFLAGTRSLLADQALSPLGNERVLPRCVPEVFAEPPGALSGPQAEGEQPNQVGVDHGGVTEFAPVVFLHQRGDTGVHLPLVVRA